MSNNILVFAEIREGELKQITLQLLSAAVSLGNKIGGQVHTAVLSDNSAPHVEKLSSYTPGKIFSARSALLTNYSTDAYAQALESIIKEAEAGYVLFGATALGKDLSSRVAAKFNCALFTDCTELDVDDNLLRVKRPVYSGKVYAEAVSTRNAIQMASIRPNIFPPAGETGRKAEVVKVGLSLSADDIKSMVKEIVASAGGRKDVTEAEIIISGGRALKSEENFKILEGLSDVLGASVGASRAAVDAGYAPHSIQVGQTGKVVNPKLYIAVGISGAIQHLVGMRTAKIIVAVNKDPNAPIFQKADYGIVGDLFEIVPLLTEEFKKLLEN